MPFKVGLINVARSDEGPRPPVTFRPGIRSSKMVPPEGAVRQVEKQKLAAFRAENILDSKDGCSK